MDIENYFLLAAILVLLGVAIWSYCFVKAVLFFISVFDFERLVAKTSDVFFFCPQCVAFFMAVLTVLIYSQCIHHRLLQVHSPRRMYTNNPFLMVLNQ